MTKELKDVQEILERFEGRKENLARKIELLDEIRHRRSSWNRETGLKSAAYDTVPANNNKVTSTVSQIAIKNIDLELELEEEIEYLTYQVDVIQKILIDIKGMNKDLYTIVVEKYINQKTWKHIAIDVSITQRSCMRRGDRALKLVQEMLSDKKYALIFLKKNDQVSA